MGDALASREQTSYPRANRILDRRSGRRLLWATGREEIVFASNVRGLTFERGAQRAKGALGKKTGTPIVDVGRSRPFFETLRG